MRPRASWLVYAASCSTLLSAGAAAGQVPWDLSPIDPTGATSPEVCPVGGDGVTAEDALLLLRRAVALVTGFSCLGVPISDLVGDVAPPEEIDTGTNPPTAIAGGDGIIAPEDALLVLRAAVHLIDLRPAAVDLEFAREPTVSPSPVFASDLNLPPLEIFPGPEDRDEGNGVFDERRIALLTRVRATADVSGVEACAFDVDPELSPDATPFGCETLEDLSSGEAVDVAIEIAAPAETGLFTAWLMLDPNDDVSEPDETDNVQSLEFPVFEAPEPLPDLAFRGLAPLSLSPEVPTSGGLVTITAKIANVGTAPVTQDFFMDLFFDPALPPEVGNCGRFERIAGGVAAGEQVDLVIPTSLGGLATGSHALWAVLDTGAQCPPEEEHADILESSEGNNATFSPQVFCVATPEPDPEGQVDLRADALEIELSGDSYTVIGAFSNVGTKDVLPMAVPPPLDAAAIELSVATFGGEPVEIEQALNCLVQGALFTIGFGQSFPLPTIVPTRIEFDLDPLNLVDESDEDNNDLCIQVEFDGSTAPCS